jgi:hypothetical protein
MKKYFRTLKYFFIQNHSSMSGTLNQKLTTSQEIFCRAGMEMVGKWKDCTPVDLPEIERFVSLTLLAYRYCPIFLLFISQQPPTSSWHSQPKDTSRLVSLSTPSLRCTNGKSFFNLFTSVLFMTDSGFHPTVCSLSAQSSRIGRNGTYYVVYGTALCVCNTSRLLT